MVNFPTPQPRPTPPPSGSATYVVSATPSAASFAAQIQSQLPGVATVIATGNTVTMTSNLGGLSEEQYDRLTAVLRPTETVAITDSSIGTVRPNGTVRALGPNKSTATALLNRSIAAKCAAGQAAALEKGTPNYKIELPAASVIDAAGSIFGNENDTMGFEKLIYSMTFNTAGGAVVAGPGTGFGPTPVVPTDGGGGTYVYDPYSG
jgi:hypothetical protein